MIGCISAHVTCLGGPQLLQEMLVGGAYAGVQRNLSPDAAPLLALLPLTIAQPSTRHQNKVSSKPQANPESRRQVLKGTSLKIWSGWLHPLRIK